MKRSHSSSVFLVVHLPVLSLSLQRVLRSAFSNQIALEFSQCSHQMKDAFAARSRRAYLLRDAGTFEVPFLKMLEQFNQMRE